VLKNELLSFLDKEREDIQRGDLLEFIAGKEIQFLDLRYPAMDGRLKTLRVPVTSLARAEEVLAEGERVDGSSLFGAIVDPFHSDLYVVPVYSTAFVDPFYPSTLDVCCRFMDYKGDLEPWTPQGVVEKAGRAFTEASGLELRALTEVEFHLLMDEGEPRFPSRPQGGYHEASPFLKGEPVLDEIVRIVGSITGSVKYAHGEVGTIPRLESRYPEVDGKRAEQYEVEFLPRPLQQAGLDTLIARWVIRNVAWRRGMTATFVPKLAEGYAGNGLHVHLELLEKGRNVMVEKGALSEKARRLVGGMVRFAGSITAFGNACAASYLRLVPGQEAPTRVFWSDNNRSAMIREPLGWVNSSGMDRKANPRQVEPFKGERFRQTVELRSPDGSADVLLTLAALACAARWGFTSPKALDLCEEAYLPGGAKPDPASLEALPLLPGSCAESAAILEKHRGDYEEGGIFPPILLDQVIRRLREEGDGDLAQRLAAMPGDSRRRYAESLMHKEIHRQ